ncbi:MAG: Mrp/NBP35 family ATP-binding protein, partial [Elusimicrobia bacterium]|nr:Mrp/NBP35 family ATP-binding protein [Elusimicrobiota bacterium]
MPTREDVLKALSTCQEPELKKDIVSLGMVQNLSVEGGKVSFDYILTTPACPLKGMMELEARDALKKVPGVTSVDIRMKASVKKDPRLENAAPSGIKNIVAVGSGKGGVGKSTVACNLAVALAQDGARVGLMDADIYGPNQPQMLGVQDRELHPGAEGKIAPAENYGVKMVSMGFLTDADAPVIWRGPMLHGAVTQFLRDVEWGELDYLIVDLPPGTGDVQLSLCQSVPLAGAVIVTTPQSIALSDVRRAAAMFAKLNVPLLGVVENMSGFSCPHCGKTSDIFSRGGAGVVAEKYGAPILGRIPIEEAVCQSGEMGRPI